MSYIRRKIINGKSYLYEQKSERVGTKVVTTHLRYVGKETSSNNLTLKSNKKNVVANKTFKDSKTKGKFLFKRQSGENVYELDATIFKIKNNPELEEKRFIDHIKNKNDRIMDGIPYNIWKKAYKKSLNIDV